MSHKAPHRRRQSEIAALSNGNYALIWTGGTQQGQFAYTAVFDAQGNQVAAPAVVGTRESVPSQR